jgi:hypothetical protein
VKTVLEGKRFQNAEDIRKNMTAEMKAVPLEAFAYSFQKLFKPSNTCIQAGGDRFE